ncbi:MAG TPA: YihY/virulence factor BrkB family protein [Thermoanaerobaculia bacterium]|nr:YihY/virulence factor BrkB family protein [Thermoanaerobaculia bacterium]
MPDKEPGHGPTPADFARAREPGRGRQAETPLEMPTRGWKDILLRTKREVSEDQLSLVAAGVAFYFMLALFPALLAIVSVYGFVADPGTVAKQAGTLVRLMPADAAKLLIDQLQQISTADGTAAGIGAIVAIVLSFWSAANGTKALLAGLNIAYDERERRGFFRLNVVAMTLTLGFIVMIIGSLVLITAVPHVVARLPLGDFGEVIAYLVTWLLLAALSLFGFAVMYRFGPSREHPRWQWVSVGSLIATALWMLASLIFSWYSARFGRFNKTYGTLAGGILLLLWLQITAYVTLLGAELNAETEHQTARDSTTGAPKPLGARGAEVADTVGEAVGDGGGEPEWRRRLEGIRARVSRRAHVRSN